MQTDLQQSKAALDDGGIILFPTDAGWSIGCDATNSTAIERIKQLGAGSGNHDMVVLLDTEVRMERYVEEVPEVAWELLEVSDKPLTLIISSGRNLADNLLNTDGSVAFRVTNDRFSRNLIQRYKKPLACYFLKINHQIIGLFEEIPLEWIDVVDYVVKATQPGNFEPGAPSIIKLGTSGEIQILKK